MVGPPVEEPSQQEVFEFDSATLQSRQSTSTTDYQSFQLSILGGTCEDSVISVFCATGTCKFSVFQFFRTAAIERFGITGTPDSLAEYQ